MSWTKADAANLRTFLARNPSFLEQLKAETPKIEGDTFEKTALTASRHAGAEAILDRIEAMATDPRQLSQDPGFINETAQ